MTIPLQVSLLLRLFFFSTGTSQIYLFNTNDEQVKMQFYDCIRDVQSSLDYCRRPTEINDRETDHRHMLPCSHNGGQVHRFTELHTKNISLSIILHQWKSTLDQAEEYAHYLRDPSSQPDRSLCQCLERGAFGKNCEYHLPVGETLEETLQWQLVKRKENPEKVQIYGDVICYETLKCDSGMLCLDWREICDGFQHCLEGRDEENCDLLEMNQCDEEEEYRCENGMCIPVEFFLDGELDCLDWSDEMSLKKDQECPLESVSGVCDDHLCPFREWSCGDGECIRDRVNFQKWADATCWSRRDEYFICETRAEKRRWTMSNGRCIDLDEDDGERYEETSSVNRGRDDQCVYLLRCSLTKGGGKGRCPCGGVDDLDCVDQLGGVCSSLPSLIRYPRRSIVAPFLFYLFNRTRNWNKNQPDFVLIDGTIRCENSLISESEKIIPFPRHSDVRYLIEVHFCGSSRDVVRSRCHQGNDESFDLCSEWNRCLSVTRLNDGRYDCLNGKDEFPQTEMESEKSCARVRRQRLRCSREQPTCLSVTALAYSASTCNNRFDQRWFASGRDLSSINCDEDTKDECSLLRQYIEQSSRSTLILTSSNQSERSFKQPIPFRSFCDSFWDLERRDDEDLRECRQWWICSKDQFRCHTGQCLEQSWFNDREWDCADASDEHLTLNSTTEKALKEASEHNFTNRPYLIPSSCPQSHPFLCLSLNATRQGFSCFNLSQIGDGHIDCAGGMDERLTLPHCSQPLAMLGSNFLCPSTNTCIPFHLHCFTEKNRCPQRSDDKYWCDRQDQFTNSDNRNQFTCFDGQRLQSSQWDGDFPCLFAEDEYMCDYPRSAQWIRSREEKRTFLRIKTHIIQLSPYPTDSNLTQFKFTHATTARTTTNLSSSSSLISPYWCNRGLGILSARNHSTTLCFCPPQYYGEKCNSTPIVCPLFFN